MESLLHAAQCGQQIETASGPEADDRFMIKAHRLWRDWLRWNGKGA